MNTLTHLIVIIFMTFDTLSLIISLLKKYDLIEKLCCQVLMKNNQNYIFSVNDRFVTEPSTIDGRSLCAPAHWQEHMSIFYLTEKMRCNTDQNFNAVCDRVGQGKITKEDEQFFQSRIISTELEHQHDLFKEGKICIAVTTNSRREDINLEKLNQLLPSEKTYTIHALDRTINLKEAIPLDKKTPYTKTGSLPSELHIKIGAPVFLTANHKKKEYKEDGIMNGARGFIEHIEVSEENGDEVTIIWIVFNDKENGAFYRAQPEHRKLRRDQALSEYATPILPVKRTFKKGSSNIEIQRKQFSLTLGYACTVHRLQGLTLDYVIVDFRDGYVIFGTFYVAITRVRAGNNLFLRDFHPGYIKVSNEVSMKIQEMRKSSPYRFLKSFIHEQCFKLDKNDFKIGYLNINCLTNELHGEYVNTDKNLLSLDLLCLSETFLTSKVSEASVASLLNNWEVIFRADCPDGKRHMGLLVLTPKTAQRKRCIEMDLKFQRSEAITKNGLTHIQIIHCQVSDERVSFLYCRQTPSIKDTEKIKDIAQDSNYILGDLNLNPDIEDQKRKLDNLCGNTKILHLRDITTVRRNQVDHIIVDKDKRHQVYTDCYLNFVSDHKSIVLRKSRFLGDEVLERNMDLKPSQKQEAQPSQKEAARPPQKRDNKQLDRKKIDEDETVIDGTNVEHIQDSLDLSSLNGLAWINDTVVDNFGRLLMKKYTDIFFFSSFFNHFFFVKKKVTQKSQNMINHLICLAAA